MNVKKPVPCSTYDIPGMQAWLDEMARHGLFLVEFSIHSDRAVFRQGEPRPVRYRLDPVRKDGSGDRDGPYAEMGWEFVCQLARRFSVYSCGDPEAPELYTDPQSLAVALDSLTKREVRNSVLITLFALALSALILFLEGSSYLRNLLLWDRPRSLVTDVLFLILMAVALPLLALDTRRVLNIRHILAQGLPLKAKRRWDRPLFWAWYIPLWIAVFWLPRLLLPEMGWEAGALSEVALSHNWPDIVQTEALGPRPLETEPSPYGYATENSSWPAPIQEERSSTWDLISPEGSSRYWTNVRYVQARSLRAAELIFRVELEDASKTLKRWARQNNDFRLTGSTTFTPLDWPGVDRLEVARYQQFGQDCWTFALLRGADILVVNYRGLARPEDCLPLFLDALDS